jgi:hypothetical protein
MAVFWAVNADVLQLAACILPRHKAPEMERPFTSRLGIPGAAIRAGFFIQAWFVCGVAYTLYAPHGSDLSPEGEFALSPTARRVLAPQGRSVPMNLDGCGAREQPL